MCSSQASFPSFLNTFQRTLFSDFFLFLFSFVLQISVDPFGDNDISRLQFL